MCKSEPNRKSLKQPEETMSDKHRAAPNMETIPKRRFTKETAGFIARTAGALWISLVVFFYFFTIRGEEIAWRSSHQYYPDSFLALAGQGGASGFHPLLFILTVVGIEYFLLCAWRRFYAGEKSIDVQLSPFLVWIIFSVFFLITALGWFGYYSIAPAFSLAPCLGVLARYALVCLALGFIVLLCASPGKAILQVWQRDKSFGLKDFLLSFGVGAMLLTGILWLCGLFGCLNSAVVWSVSLALLAVSYRHGWGWIKAFFKSRIRFQGSYSDSRLLLFCVFSIILGHHVLELIRPIPLGFDDLAVYMNIPNLLAQGGKLPGGIDAYSWGIFMSLGFLLFHSATVALFLSFLGGLLACLALYVCVQSYGRRRGIPLARTRSLALLAVTLFYSLPAVVFQSSKDMKVDLAALLFMLLAFISFLDWREKDQRDAKSLWLCGLFLGFAFTVKYTALFFIVVLLAVVLFHLIREKPIRRGLQLTVFILCIAIPFVPYGIKNIADAQQFSVEVLRSGKTTAPSIAMNPPIDVSRGVSSLPPDTGVHEEQGRYAGYDSGIWKYLRLPLTVTLNSTVRGMYVDIGYLFLALVPLGFIAAIRGCAKTSFQAGPGEILALGAAYWTLWWCFAKGVIWYGFGGFLFLLLIICELIHAMKEKNGTVFKTVTFGAVALWFLCALVLRTANLPAHGIGVDPAGLAYAGGVIDKEEYMKRRIPAYLTIMNIVNRDIESNLENPPKIYRVGTFIKYFIIRNDTLVLDDNQLNVFMSVFRDRDDQNTIDRFRNAGFKYMVIDANTAMIDQTPGQTLRAKYREFAEFIKRNPADLKVIYDDPGRTVLLIQIL